MGGTPLERPRLRALGGCGGEPQPLAPLAFKLMWEKSLVTPAVDNKPRLFVAPRPLTLCYILSHIVCSLKHPAFFGYPWSDLLWILQLLDIACLCATVVLHLSARVPARMSRCSRGSWQMQCKRMDSWLSGESRNPWRKFFCCCKRNLPGYCDSSFIQRYFF